MTNCENCKKEYAPTHQMQKFCSRECRRHHQNAQNRLPAYAIQRTCAKCQKSFELTPKLGGGNRKYCSRECAYSARIESNRKMSLGGVKPRSLWKCRSCGAEVDSPYRRLCDACKIKMASRRAKPRELWKCRDCGAELDSPYHQFCENCLFLHKFLTPLRKKTTT